MRTRRALDLEKLFSGRIFLVSSTVLAPLWFLVDNIHTLSQKVSSRLTLLIEITHLKCNAEFSSAHFECLFNVNAYHFYCEITQFMKSGARKKKLNFLSKGPIALQCMTLKYQHKTQPTHNEVPSRPIEEKCHFFFPSTLFIKTDVLIMKIMLTTRIVHDKVLFMLIFKCTN